MAEFGGLDGGVTATVVLAKGAVQNLHGRLDFGRIRKGNVHGVGPPSATISFPHPTAPVDSGKLFRRRSLARPGEGFDPGRECGLADSPRNAGPTCGTSSSNWQMCHDSDG